MATIKKFEDLAVWQEARILENKIFAIIISGKASKDFGLIKQINKSAGSVMDNIAEGFGRGSRNEFIQFLSIARGSLNEVQSQLYRTLDRNHITSEEFDELFLISENTAKKISAFINYLNKSKMQGNKFKERTVIK